MGIVLGKEEVGEASEDVVSMEELPNEELRDGTMWRVSRTMHVFCFCAKYGESCRFC